MVAAPVSTYKPEHCETAIEFGKQGKSIAALAAHLETSRKSLYYWAKDHPEWQHALDVMREHAEAYWEAIGEAHQYLPPDSGTFNAAVWKFFMGNRFKWGDRVSNEITGDGSFTVNIKPPSQDDSVGAED